MNRKLSLALLSHTDDMAPLAKAWQALYPEHDLRLTGALGRLDEIEAAVCWFPPPGVLARLPNLKLIQSVGAGIEHLLQDPGFPSHIPTFRIVDTQMASTMAAYVAWAVTSVQRGSLHYAQAQDRCEWSPAAVQAPQAHRVGVLGLGELGLHCARTLAALGYPVAGWSRSRKGELPATVQGFAGSGQFSAFLTRCDTLICLLPLTEDTQGLLDQRLFAQLPVGAHLINVGRGAHLVEEDLLGALASGQLGQATLDTFSVEPLPAEHPFWRHPKIRITPHIATRTPVATIAAQLLDNFENLHSDANSPRRVEWARGY